MFVVVGGDFPTPSLSKVGALIDGSGRSSGGAINASFGIFLGNIEYKDDFIISSENSP